MCVFIFIYFVLFDCFSSLLSLPSSSLLLTPSTLDVWVDSMTPSEDLTWMPPWFKPGMQGPTQVLRAEVMTTLIFLYSRDLAHVNILMLRHQKYYLHCHHKLSSKIYLLSNGKLKENVLVKYKFQILLNISYPFLFRKVKWTYYYIRSKNILPRYACYEFHNLPNSLSLMKHCHVRLKLNRAYNMYTYEQD